MVEYQPYRNKQHSGIYQSPELSLEPAQRKQRRNVAKSIPYGPTSSILSTIQAIARYKSWSCNMFLREVGYSSSSIHTSWLNKGTCPQWIELVVAGWLSQRNLMAVRDKQGGVQIEKAGAPNKTVEIQHELVPVSVPLTRQNVLDLIGLCATNGEQQLIIPLANLLGDKNVTLNED